MNKIKAVFVEVREDANEESIHASLQTKAKPKQDAKAAVAQNPHDQETTKGLTQSVKEKVEVLKLRRMLRQSQRRSPRTVAKLPRHVSSGQKAHATGGRVVCFFMILKPNQQRSQGRLRQQMQRQQLQFLLQQAAYREHHLFNRM
jgi:hypothetical protein